MDVDASTDDSKPTQPVTPTLAPAPAVPSLRSLPKEVKLCIVKLLEADGKRALRLTTLLSREFRKVALPLYYNTIDLSDMPKSDKAVEKLAAMLPGLIEVGAIRICLYKYNAIAEAYDNGLHSYAERYAVSRVAQLLSLLRQVGNPAPHFQLTIDSGKAFDVALAGLTLEDVALLAFHGGFDEGYVGKRLVPLSTSLFLLTMRTGDTLAALSLDNLDLSQVGGSTGGWDRPTGIIDCLAALPALTTLTIEGCTFAAQQSKRDVRFFPLLRVISISNPVAPLDWIDTLLNRARHTLKRLLLLQSESGSGQITPNVLPLVSLAGLTHLVELEARRAFTTETWINTLGDASSITRLVLQVRCHSARDIILAYGKALDAPGPAERRVFPNLRTLTVACATCHHLDELLVEHEVEGKLWQPARCQLRFTTLTTMSTEKWLEGVHAYDEGEDSDVEDDETPTEIVPAAVPADTDVS